MKTRDSKGTSSSYGAELSEILADLNSSEMRRFCAACDALSCREETGFELLKPYRSAKDIRMPQQSTTGLKKNLNPAILDLFLQR